MDKKSSSTTERFSVTDADNFLGEMSQPSTQLLAELIDYLRARGDAQDAGLAQALESQGWSVLTTAQIQMLLLQFKALAQADALQLAQADANATQGAAPTTDGAPSSSALSELKPITTETKDAAPAPANSSAPTPSFAGQIMELLSRSDLVAPANSVQISGPESSPSASNPGTPTLGSAILSSLAAGQLPGVSAATVVQSNAGAPLSVPGVQTPQVAAPTTAPITSAVSTLLASAAGTSSGPSSSTSSNVAVSRMPASASLGASAELSNAASITPYVEQKVSTTGSLVSAPIVPGSTETGNTKTTTSYVRPNTAEVLGGVLSVARVVEKITPPTVEAPRPPDPFGNVSIGFHKSMLLTSEGQDGGGTNLNLPRTIYEGTSNSGSTPVNLVVSRVNPLMPDDIGFVITGLNGLVDVANIFYGDTEINQSLVTITVDEDGTIRGLVHFEGGETDKVLTINIRQDATIERLETMSVALQPGLFGLLLTGNHKVDMDVANDDWLSVSIEAQTAAVWEGNDANTGDNTIETSPLAFTLTRSKPVGPSDNEGWPAEDMVWTLHDPGHQIVLRAGMTRDPVTHVVTGTVRFPAQPAGTSNQSVNLVLETDRNGVQEVDWKAVVTLQDSPLTHVNPSSASASTWVLDDDPTIAVDPNPPIVLEGGVLRFTIHRTTALDIAFNVDYQLLPTSGGADYITAARTGSVHFGINESTAYVDVPTLNDALVNDPRQLVMNITRVSQLEDANGQRLDGRVYVAAGSSVGTITNDDAEISIDSIIASLPDADGMVTFTVTLSREGEEKFRHGVKWSIVGVGENPLDPLEVVDTKPNRNILFEANELAPKEFTFKAPAGMLIDGGRTFEVRLLDLTANDVSGGADIAARTALGVDAARGTVIPNGVSASVVPVLTNLAEGSNGESTTHTFKVVLSEAAGEAIEIAWHVRGYNSGTVLDSDKEDFVLGFPSGTFTIPAGQTEFSFDFTTNADNDLEITEKFVVAIEVLNGPAGVVGAEARGSIVNDDALIGFAEANAEILVNEGMPDAGGTLTIDVLRSGFARSEISVAWRVELIDEAATPAQQRAAFADLGVAGADHLPSGRITIAAGQTVGTIAIPLFGDNVLEASEKFRIVLLDDAEPNELRGGATLISEKSVATAVIVNDDAVISMAIASYAVTEGQGGSKNVTLTVVRDSQGEDLPAATVQWLASASGTGALHADKNDFAAGKFPSGTAIFAAGSNEATILFTVNADDLLEERESFVVTLVGTGSAQHSLDSDPAKLSAIVTLTNDDDQVAFSSTGGNLAQSLDEDGSAHAGQTITYNLTRTGDLTKSTTVFWHLDFEGKTATASDFADGKGDPYADDAQVQGTAVFAEGSSIATIVLRPVKDITVEANETFSVVLDTTGLSANGTRLANSNTTANGVLVNDDVEISVLESASVTESATGTVTITFTVSRSGDTSHQDTDLSWAVNGSTIVVNGLRLADALASSEFSSADNDTNSTDPVLHWAAGDVSTRTITVTVNGDTLVEGDEALKLTLSNTNDAPLADLSNAQGKTVTVRDNDARIWAEALRPSVTEGKQGESQEVVFRIYREGDISSGLSVALSHQGASGVTGPTSATFPAAGFNTEYLPNGMARQYVDVTYVVAGDDILDSPEKLQLNLGALTPALGFNATVDSARPPAQMDITNDDNAISVSSDVTQIEEGATIGSQSNPHRTVTFTLTRDQDGTLAAGPVQWRLAGSGQNQVNELDFDPGQENPSIPNNGLPSGTVNFALGALTATVTVILSGDLSIEPNEGMKLVLSAPNAAGNLQVVNPDYTVTVVADDVGINVLPRDAELTEGNAPSLVRSVFFDVARIGPTTPLYWKIIPDSDAISVDATSADFADGQATSGPLTFDVNGGALVQLNIRQDSLEEAPVYKTVTIGLYSDADCTEPVTKDGNVHYTATTVLKDDDATLNLVASSGASVYEGTDPNLLSTDTTDPYTDDYSTLTFTIQRTGNTDQVSEVPWSVALTNGLTADDFYDGITSGTVTFPANGTVTKTITLKVKKDWLEEGDEAVTVTLGTPSAGTSLDGGIQSKTTTVRNDDVTVQFATHSRSLSEGDSGVTVFSFDVTRTGDTANQASTVTWTIQPNGALNSVDFARNISEQAGSGLTYSYDAYSGMPTGTVTFAAGQTLQTVKVYVNADTFGKERDGYFFTQGTKLEENETFSVVLSNGSTTYSQRNSTYGVNTPDDGTLIGTQGQAVGTIVNDDIKIQITNIRTNLPEGTAADSNGDVDPAHAGVQSAIEQSITFERTGDLSQAVWFDWVVNTANFSNQMVAGQAFNGRVEFLANASSATITFRPLGDNTVEPNYTFTLDVAAAHPSIDEFSFGTNTGVVVNRNPGELLLATFNIMRDEAGVWVSNEVVRDYDNWDSQQSGPYDTYSAEDRFLGQSVGGPVYGPGDTREINYSGPDDKNMEGSLGTAQSLGDYTSLEATTLTFTSSNRSQTVTLAIHDDGTYETREGLGIFLSGAENATVADSQSRVTIVDNDNPTPTYQVNVTGSTSIEGMDDTVSFTVELGKGLTQDSTFEIELSDNSQASLSRESGEAGDLTRYFEYSTDGGSTWQTSAPVFDFTYTAERQQSVDDQLTVAYSFNNNNSDNDSWDSWLEFSDLKADVPGQRVGNTLTGKSHGRPEPSRIDVVVDDRGGWVDTDGDRYRDGDERVAFDEWGNDRVDLAKNAVSITFIEVPNSGLYIYGFGEDDRINIDYGRLHEVFDSSEGGTYANYDGSRYVEANRRTDDMPSGVNWHKGYTKSGSGGLGDYEGFAVAARSSNYQLRLYGFSAEVSGVARSDALAYGINNTLDQTQIFDRVSFVNVGEGEAPPNIDGPQELSTWIAVRADASVVAADLSVKISGSGGDMQGRVAGVLDLMQVSSEADSAQRQAFLAWWNESFNDNYAPVTDSDWATFSGDVQAYFDDFSARLSDGPKVKFVQVQIDWDGYGQMSWSVEGLDPKVVLAPQDGSPFSDLQLLQDITVDAGSTSASADVALGAQAIFDTDNGMSAVAALERDGLQPAFEVVSDETDINGVRTVEMKVTRPADLGEDVLRYEANFPTELTAAHLLSGSAALSGQLAFAKDETEKTLTYRFNAVLDDNASLRDLPQKLHVIVDHNPNDEAGAIGAYIDTDRDGVLDADEAVASNLAFSATGEDLVGVNARSVTVRFNDFADVPINLSGFGGDDRIEINIDELSRYWKVGPVTEFDFTSDSFNTIRDGRASTSLELTGRTPMDRGFGFDVSARRESLDSSYTACLTVDGYRWTENGDDNTSFVFATFGFGEDQNPIIDGALTLAGQISFVTNPTVHVVVEAEGAYIDLDQDGELEINEANDANRAFDAQGAEVNAILRHAPVVLHFNDAPDSPLDLRNFGRDDRIEIDVAAFRANGWAIPEVGVAYNKRLLSDDEVNGGDGAAAMVYEFDGEGARDFFGVVGDFSNSTTKGQWCSNSAAIKFFIDGSEVESAVFGNFGLDQNYGEYNRMVQDDKLYRQVSFVNTEGQSTVPVQDIHVVVDHYDNAGSDAVGAFIDLDKDGVLDANEAKQNNLAFNADGTSNIDLARHRVTVQFNDAHGKTLESDGSVASTVPLDFTGFGADDRIEINMNGLSANGWRMPDARLTSYEMDVRQGTDTFGNWDSNNQYQLTGTRPFTYSYLELSGCTVYGHELELEVRGTNIWVNGDGNFPLNSGDATYALKLRAEHTSDSGQDYTSENIKLAEFSDGFHSIGSSQFIKQVSFVRDPVVHVVVEKEGAFFDLDADGLLDNNETGSDNRANQENGLDLAHQSVVVRFNDIPADAIDLSGFGRDDRIEVDVSRMGLMGAFGIDRTYDTDDWTASISGVCTIRTQDYTSTLYATQMGDRQVTVEFTRSYGQGVERTASSGFKAWYEYTNEMSINNNLVAYFGSEYDCHLFGTDFNAAYNWTGRSESPTRMIDGNGGMINRVSFVSTAQKVLITQDGGWIDSDGDGLLDTTELTEANRAFAADGSARIDLADKSYVLRFLDAPDRALDLSGFNRDDRIEIDQSQLAARGWLGADNSADNPFTGSMDFATKQGVAGESGTLAVWAGNAPFGNGLFLFGTTSSSETSNQTKAMLGDFGPDNGTGGEGDLSGRLSFVQSTIHVVVESHGAYLDENANGRLDGHEQIQVFDPLDGHARINLENHKVVIEFNDVPDVAIDLNGFGSDDRIEIDRRAFHTAGWGGVNATHLVNDWNSYCTSGVRGFTASEGFSRLVVSVDGGDLSLNAATKGLTSNSAQLAYGFGYGQGDGPQTLLSNNVSFVQDNLISGFGGDHAISLEQGGSFSGGGMQYTKTITAEVGTDKILVRAPIVDDHIDEDVETIDLTVRQQSGDTFAVPDGSGTSTLVDDDSPQIDLGSNTLYDGQLQQFFFVKTIDINNRSTQPNPHTGYGEYFNNNTDGPDYAYYSDSLSEVAGAAQSFTVRLRFQGQWELALISESMPSTGQAYLSGMNLNNSVMTYTDGLHNSPPPFLPVVGAAERDDLGELTGYFVYDVQVAVGTKQVLMRSAVSPFALTPAEVQVTESLSVEITHVDPIIVARDVLIDENAGTATVEVIAVGGDFGDEAVSVDVQTADGQWVDRTFTVSREYATAGTLTLHWSVEALGGTSQSVLIDGEPQEYVRGYFAHTDVSTVNADDFVLLDGQVAGATARSPGLPTGTVTFADGQKEAFITVRVLADNVGEEKEDFRVVLAQPPAGVQLLGNPDAPQTYATNFDAAGYARINNDDQLFIVKGLVINEAQHSKVVGDANEYNQDAGSGMAISGIPANVTAPVGYTLHQFIITREGDARAAASVDYVFQVKGIDVEGFIETPTLADQGAGAHQAETADFLSGGAYGFTWGAVVDGVTSSAAKTVVFAAGEEQKVVTFAVADDALLEDAEQFRVMLTNPQALPGNDGNPGVSDLRGKADFLIGDNEGTTVSVRIDWMAADHTRKSLSNDLGNNAVDNAFYEGTSSDWLTNGNNDDGQTDAEKSNDHRLVLTFTRSKADATASQAFFEIDLSRSQWGARDMVLESGAVGLQQPYVDTSWWRGTVDFAAGSTTATVVFRVPDDNIIEPNQTLMVTLYDAEHLPESRGDTDWGFNDGTAPLADMAGIGGVIALPDWNTTIRDPNAYQASATVVSDDIRLWLGGFRGYHNNDRNAYDWTPDGDSDTGTSIGDAWESYTLTEGNPEDAYTGDQNYNSGNGDFALSFGRAGVQSGDIQLNWAVVLGTASYADFNSAYWVDAQGDHTLLLADVVGVKGSVTLSGSASTNGQTTIDTKIAQLLSVDRDVENNETFQLTFSVDGSPSNVLFTPNYSNEAPGGSDYSAVLQGRGTMTVDMVALNDDVVYGISLASTELDNRVVEGDGVSSTIKFDLTRTLGISVNGGFHDSSSVGWRIVAANGHDIDANDFVGGLSGSTTFVGQTWNGSGWARPADGDGNLTNADVHQVLTITINPDSEVEYGEYFIIELCDPTVGYVDAAHSSVGAVIVNDDTGVLINNFNVTEGDSGTSLVEATVVRVGDLSSSSTFNWAKYNVDTNGTDFDATGASTGLATISANSAASMLDGFGVETYTLTTSVKLKGDAPAVPGAAVGSLKGSAAVEDDEKFRLVLDKDSGIDQMLAKDVAVADNAAATVNALNAGSYVLSSAVSASAFGTVLNDDTIFSVTPVTVSKSESSGTAYTFTVTRSVATPQSQTVTWSVLGEGGRNMVNANDFGLELPTGTVTFTGGELSQTITVAAPNTDADPEADEVFVVKVTDFGTGAENDMFVTTGAGAKGVIVNDDAAIYINDSQPITQMEGSGAIQQTYKFDVVRSGLNVTGTSTVDWKVQLTADGAESTAKRDDFATLPTTLTASGWYDEANHCIRGTVTFTKDSYDLQTVSLALNPDGTKESTESFVVSLDNPIAVTSLDAGSIVASSNNATGNIGDDDYDLSVEVVGVEGVEFGTLRSLPATTVNGVSYELYGWNGSGTAYANVKSVLSSQPWFVEGGWGSLPQPASGSLGYKVQQHLSNIEKNNGIAVMSNEDGGYYTYRYFMVTPWGAGSYSGTNSQPNSESTPLDSSVVGGSRYWLISKLPVSAPEEGDGNNNLQFTVTRDGATDLPADATWTLVFGNDNAQALAAGILYAGDKGYASADDFRAVTGNFVFPAGASTFTFTVPINGDLQWEENEVFTLKMDYDRNNGTSGTAWAKAALTNDDEGFSVTVADANEGSTDAPGSITIKVVREGNLEGTSSVDWAISASGTQGVSTSGSTNDFMQALRGTVNFNGTESSLVAANGQSYSYKLVTVALTGDAIYEKDETFTVTLSNAGEGSSIKSATATGKVVNDDMGYFVSVKDGQTQVVEGNEGESSSASPAGTPPGTVTFVVTRECDPNTLANPSTVAWSLAIASGDTSALESGDVIVTGGSLAANGLSGTVEFLAHETRKEITVTLIGDGVLESSAALAMTLLRTAEDTTSTLVASTASVNLTDDDDTLSISPQTALELAEGDIPLAYTSYLYEVTRTGSGLGVATVDWAVAAVGSKSIDTDDIDSIWVNGASVSVSNFAQGSFTWDAGDLASQLIEVRVKHDRQGEWDEQFGLTLSNPSYGSNLGTAMVTQTVINDDPALTLSMGNTRIIEGNDEASGTAFTFVVTRSGDTDERSSVRWQVEADSAELNETDFGGLFPGGTVVFEAGERVKTVTVLTGGDVDVEDDEDFRIVLSNENNANVVGPKWVLATIADDDVAVSVRSLSSSVVEGAEGTEVIYQFVTEAKGPVTATRATVTWHIEGAGLHPTIGNDFLAGILPRGETTVTLRQGLGFAIIDVPIAGDNVFGPSEQFKIVIDEVAAFAGNTPIGASATVSEAIAEVLDDDLRIGLVQDSPEVVEGDVDNNTVLKFYVEDVGSSFLSPSLSQVRLDYSVSGMVNSDDFDGPISGTDVALNEDSGGYYLELVVKGDIRLEDHEQFKLRIDRAYAVDGDSNPVGNVEIAEEQSFVTGLIQGDDYGIQLATVTTAQNEDSARFNFELIRLGPIDVAMDVEIQIGAPLNGSGDVVSSDDFINLNGFVLSSGVLTKTVQFEAGQGAARFELEAAHDTRNENNERFSVMASVDKVDGASMTPTADEVSFIDCLIYDETSDMLPLSADPVLQTVVDHSA